MPDSRMRISRHLMLALTTIQLAGCTHWGQPLASLPEPNGGAVRVWQGRTPTVLGSATFTPDSLIGTHGPGKTRLAFARGEIDSLNVRRTNVVGTVILLAVGVGLVKLIAFAIDFSSYANN